jgi:serine/threonine protein kinase
MNRTEFGKYTLIERISHGGMAEVFRAKTTGAAGFERTVALKVLLPQIASEEDVITMLIDEAKIAGQLSHANIAQTFDLGQVDGRYFIVQEFVDGLDLRRLTAKLKRRGGGALEIGHACHIVLRVCEGLDYAHNKRDLRGVPLEIVHRDISPQNVIVSYEGEVKLIDFGIARAAGRVTRTLAGLVKGKFAYMSPEQIRGLPTDRRSDVFACGILLHELLSGKPLFLRDSDYETLERTRSAAIEPPSAHDPSIPPELDRITLRALARHVEDRYPSALALRDDLWAFVQQHGCHSSRGELGAWMRSAFDESNTVPSAMPVEELSQVTDADAADGFPGTYPGSLAADADTLTGGTIVDRVVDRVVDRGREHDTAVGGGRPAHRGAPAFLDETTSERPPPARFAPAAAPVAPPPAAARPVLRGRAPSISGRGPTRDPDRSSPYLAYVDPNERARSDSIIPREDPNREDLVPTSLELLRSSGILAPLPPATAAAPPRRRGDNVVAAVIIVLLIGVAVVGGLVLWRNADPIERAAP